MSFFSFRTSPALARFVVVYAAILTCGVFLLSPSVASAQNDPLEGFNRTMHNFNSWAVRSVINPSATLLEAWVPEPARRIGTNIYSNVTEPEFIVTNLFKGYYQDAGVSVARFAINSTLGLVGMFEVANSFGLKRREIEFGEAMCSIGAPVGSYLVLPLIGPTNVASAGLLTGFFAVEWYALSMISTILASADLVVDLSASAASLRHAADAPALNAEDTYQIQRTAYMLYLQKGCAEAGILQTPTIPTPIAKEKNLAQSKS
ncbi:phospholipid-binding lipoprotein MlaA [Azospirillaceae bacterium]